MKPQLLCFILLFVAVRNAPSHSRQEKSNLLDDIIENILDFLSNVASDISDRIPNITVNHEDVHLYYYTNFNTDIPIVTFNLKDTDKLYGVFDSNKHSAFLVHGWLSNATSTANTLVKDAILRTHDVNLFVVEWPAESNDYFLSFGRVTIVGQYLGEFINTLNRTFNYPFSNVMMIGHSLGAHICGVTGKNTRSSINSIVGLDPAGPGFTENVTYNRLTQSDAQFVEVIHTCMKFLGIDFPIGTADFFPNGGYSQPMCNLTEDLTGSCSHSMAYRYYARSITDDEFIATKCESYELYEIQNCSDNEKAYMGGLYLDKGSSGNYYLDTNNSDSSI